MKNVTVTSREIVEVTPEQAKKWTYLCDPQYQRKVKESHVAKLVGLMQSGAFTTGSIAVADIVGGETMIADGQHTLHAIAQHNEPVACVVIRYQCDDLAAYGILYHSFNTEDRKRTTTDCAHAALMTGAVDSGGMAPSMLAKFSMGLKAYYTSLSKDFPVVRLDQFKETDKYPSAKATYSSLLDDTGVDFRNWLTRSGCCAAFIATHESGAPIDQVRAFWLQIVTGLWDEDPATGGKVHKQTPIVKLREWLATSVLDGGNVTGANRITPKEQYYTCLFVWNLWCNRRASLPKFYVCKQMPKSIMPGLCPIEALQEA